MAKTGGYKELPLSDFLDHGLRELGFKPVGARVPGIHSWRHPKYPTLTLDLIRGNVPGSTDVKVVVARRPVSNMSEDALMKLLEFELATLGSPNQKVRL